MTPELAAEAVAIAEKVAEALGHVGVLAVEMFVVRGGAAPRQRDRAARSQFRPLDERRLRSPRSSSSTSARSAGWPLGDTDRHSDVVMENLIGDDVGRWPEVLAEPGARLHLYGKAEARPGRKMGHVNRLRPPEKL